jgi:trimeric autotransporter adhesin
MNSFKKIALVTAAALSFATFSALPSQAAVNADVISIDSATDAVSTGESATAVVTVSFLAQSTSDTVTVTSSVTSLPVGSASLATLSVQETSSAVVALTSGNYSANIASTANTATYVTAKIKATVDAPSIAGTYIYKFTPSLGTGSTGGVNSAAVVWTVTVKAADLTPSASTTTAITNAGEVTTATADASVYAPKATATDAAAVIVVTPKNAAGGAATESILATVTGSGLIGHGANATTITAQGRALVIPTGNYIGVFADGTAGVSTITLTTLTGTVIATEKVTFYGDIASVVATPVKSVITVGANTSTVKAVAYDAAGVTVGAGTLNAYSSDVAVVSDSGTAATIVDGVATFTLTGVKAGGVAITIKSGTISSNPVSTRVEGTATTAKLSFDKEVYMPGEAATIKVTVLDASGLPVSGKTHSALFATGGITSTYAFGSGSDVLTATSITTDTDTVKSYKVFMPLTENTVTISATGGTSLPLAGQVLVAASAKVSNEAAKAATKASEDAAKAAQGATDAALAAAKAAEAATAQAQAATDAVAKLSADVSAMISSLKKQITSLTALVVKIQKKVKA